LNERKSKLVISVIYFYFRAYFAEGMFHHFCVSRYMAEVVPGCGNVFNKKYQAQL